MTIKMNVGTQGKSILDSMAGQGFKINQEFTSSIPDMPQDITDLDDLGVMRLWQEHLAYSEFILAQVTVAEMDDEKRSPAEREARQMMKDRKAAKEAEAAYNANVTSEGMKKGGKVKSAKYMSFSKTGKPAGMKNVTKMANGGYVKAADGIAQRGKTRGTMC